MVYVEIDEDLRLSRDGLVSQPDTIQHFAAADHLLKMHF